MTSICNLKLCIKYKLINHIVNNIKLTQNSTYVLRVQWICNPMIKFSKYIVMLMILSKVVNLDYNQFCN